MKLKSTLIALLFAGFSFAQIQFPQVSSKAEFEQIIGFTEVEVSYFRPNLNNRTAFGGIVPFGEVWRTGANNNTTIEFKNDVVVEGKPLVKGKYALYTIPNKADWEVIFYKLTDNWGNPKDWNEKQIAAKVKVPTSKVAEKIETFTIGFENVNTNNGKLFIAWENTKVNVLVEVNTHQTTLNNIKNQLTENSSARDFYGAANYYYNNNIDIKQAQEWINKAIAKDPKAPQHFFDLKNKIDKAIK